MIELNKIYEGEASEVLATFPDRIANCCVSSPPYWALRNYGHEDQIGMEPTPAEYVSKMVSVFGQTKRILKEDGTLWINISDTYYGGKGNNGASIAYSVKNGAINQKALLGTIPGSARPNDLPIPGLKPKDLVGIPWMLAFALRDDGWYWRDTIIWHKPNPMPESVLDRCITELIKKYFASLEVSRKSKLPKDWAITNGYERSLRKTADPPKEEPKAQRSLFDLAQ